MEVPFDPDAPASGESGIFGLGTPPEEAGVRILGVPFDATTSYRKGARHGPRAILAASGQVDLHDPLQASWPGGDGRPWAEGIHLEIDEEIASLGDGGEVNERVQAWAAARLEEGRLPVILGGDHASPFGAIAAAAGRHEPLGLLHFDAHADLRVAYEGHVWSHASILHNVLERLPAVESVLSVGLRDVGEGEARAIAGSGGRVRAIFDHEWAGWRLSGADLVARAREALAPLPADLWITFDVDGLDPALCPNTGTPVPGGLRWDELNLWLGVLAASGKRVVGLDLCEVSPGEGADLGTDSWDAIVGARLLYRLVGCALATR